jgi:DUF971 family protein
MAGLDRETPIPTGLIVHAVSRQLELQYANEPAHSVRLSFELLRVESPSAEVKGHGPGQEVLQIGKQDVTIKTIEPVGNYGIKPVFSDGHDTGIYSWDYLHHLATHQELIWATYLKKLEAAGYSVQTTDTQSQADKPAAPFVATAISRKP